MNGKGKLLKYVERLLRFPVEYSFKELRAILENFGYEAIPPKRGSHWKFVLKRPLKDVNYEANIITVPSLKGRYVKRTYLKMVAKFLNLEEWYEKNKKGKGKN